jgi:peptide/nickel transport system substrate-binding protein
MASDAGSTALTGKRDFDKAKKLIAEAGYNGEKIVVLEAVDLIASHVHGLVVADLLRKLGLNVEVATSDWGTLVTRRASKKPIGEGGWNVFGTDFLGAEMLNPWLNPPLPANGEKAWFGWPKDDTLEALRQNWLKANDSEERQEIAAKIQERAFETVPYIPTGQYLPKTAYRKNVKGVIDAPALLMWNVEKV